MALSRAPVVSTAAALRLLVVAALAGGAWLALVAQPAQAASTDLLTRTVVALHDRSGPGDNRYYAGGDWLNGSSACWTCRTGPAVGAAAVADTRPDLLPAIVGTMDSGLATQRADGSIADTETSADITSAWFGVNLGLVILLVGDRVDPTVRARWITGLTRAADFLIAKNNPGYYVNGNINLSVAETFRLAAAITGDQRYAQAYEATWSYTLATGLVVERAPTRADGGDGMGFLKENGGFDPGYAQLQLDVLASLYSVSRDPRALWVMNLLMNRLLPRVGRGLTFDARGGSRLDSVSAFMTAALPLLVATGSRPDLAPLVPTQDALVSATYAQITAATPSVAAVSSFPVSYRGVATWLATPVIFARFSPQSAAPTPVAVAAPAPAARKRSSRISAPVSFRIDGSLLRVSVVTFGRRVQTLEVRCGRRLCGRERRRTSVVRPDGTRVTTFKVRITRRWVRRGHTRRARIEVELRGSQKPRLLQRQISLRR